MIIRPYGYAIWENMVAVLDKCLKKPTCKCPNANVYSRKPFNIEKNT